MSDETRGDIATRFKPGNDVRKGTRKTGGRAKGVPNKATRNAREAIAAFVEDNAERLNNWLSKIEDEEGAQAAFRCFMDVVEYHIPKLARTEVTGENGKALEVQIVRYGDTASK